ncbi:hypothetical protein [Mycolicibacter sinensis]|uniref:Uncharacterized protein n=1 Tax=Mycolicibacter sinensis (strain JDM601) TaxID=875328 RepID=A0A1A3U972_MYCSD|nr:hypothetical protein [Mycolicibacter sinensis]OBK91490.1 hypothetical protein A5648_14100 [Mycolicibacter sinensis]
MRRRRPQPPPEVAATADPTSWPQCDRWDGGTQPCSCWFGEHVRAENLDVDMFAVLGVHKCNKPFRYDEI